MPGEWSEIKKAITKKLSNQKTPAANKILGRQATVTTVPTITIDGQNNTCTYTVQANDTLWSIAKKIYKDATLYEKIINDNKLKYPEIDKKLSIDWLLSVPCAQFTKRDNITSATPTIIYKNNQKQQSTNLIKRVSNTISQFFQFFRR